MLERLSAHVTTARLRWLAVGFGLLLTALATKTPWAPFAPWIILAAGVSASFSLVWLSRRPLLVVLIGSVGNALSGNPWPMWVGVGAVGRGMHGPDVVAAVILSASSWVGLEILQGGSLRANEVGAALAQAIVVAGAGIYLGTRKQLVESLRVDAERAEADRVLREGQARMEERERIAREMHDLLAHKVTLIAVHAGALEVSQGSTQPEVGDAARLIRTTANDALEELREVLGMLRGQDRPEPSAAFVDVEQLVEDWRSAGMAIELDDRRGQLSPTSARTVYRVVQEGLTNARKHAPEAAVQVAIVPTAAGDVCVTVTNHAADGPGADISGARVGLAGLEERLRLVGGRLRAEPGRDGGWRLEAWVPTGARAVHT